MNSSSIILMGIKHCGKSTQARLLSQHYSIPSYDTDDIITEITGKTPREIYSSDGKEAFMAAEVKACESLKARLIGNPNNAEFNAVIATGGGICNNPDAVEILKTIGTLVFLNSDEETAVSRILREVQTDSDGKLSNLPAYIAKENPQSLDDVRKCFHNFYTERKEIYSSICSIHVSMKPVSKAENMNAILQQLSSTNNESKK